MRKVRGFFVGIIVGALLMLGGQAIADIPDTAPSAPDTSRTFFVCVSMSDPYPHKAMRALDKSQGNGQCPSGWTEKELVPDSIDN